MSFLLKSHSQKTKSGQIIIKKNNMIYRVLKFLTTNTIEYPGSCWTATVLCNNHRLSIKLSCLHRGTIRRHRAWMIRSISSSIVFIQSITAVSHMSQICAASCAVSCRICCTVIVHLNGRCEHDGALRGNMCYLCSSLDSLQWTKR